MATILPLDGTHPLRDKRRPMKHSHFYVSVAVAALCLILSVTVVFLGTSNQKLQWRIQKLQTQLQTELPAQQQEINKGVAIQQQYGPNIIKDMLSVAGSDSAMKDLLDKHGIKTPPATDRK